MTGEQIGKVSKIQDFSEDEALVAFKLPYGESTYSIAFDHDELDKVFQSGIQRIFANRSLSSLDFVVELEGPDLPLFIGAKALNIKTLKNAGYPEVDMGISVVTQSIITENEHRGTLFAQRDSIFGSWRATNYESDPPLIDRTD